MTNSLLPSASSSAPYYRWAWIGLLGGSSIGFSLVFACATPFVALVTLAAINMNRRDAFLVTVSVWLANQAVGYGILGYPRTPDSFAWGAAIGVAALLALLAARSVCHQLVQRHAIVTTAAAFAIAFVVYELTLYVSAFWLPSSEAAFSWPIVLYILQVNAIALGALFVLCYVASLLGLPRSDLGGNRA
jgi:hypothetical protein